MFRLLMFLIELLPSLDQATATPAFGKQYFEKNILRQTLFSADYTRFSAILLSLNLVF